MVLDLKRIIGLSGPTWFLGLDLAIQLLGAILALVIAYYGYKSYKITNRNKDLYFSLAFLLLSINLFIYLALIPSTILYYVYSYGTQIPSSILILGSQLFNFIFIFSTMFAYALLILVYSDLEKKNFIILIFSLIFSLAAFSYVFKSILGFNLVSALLLVFIVFHTYKNYIKKKTRTSLLVLMAFIFLIFSHISFALNILQTSTPIYLTARSLQFLGFASFLIMLIRVYYGRKKK